MEYLVFIGIIIAVINALNKNAKKANKVVRSQMEERSNEQQDDAQLQMSELQADEPSYPSHEGVGYQDDYGCVGSTLPHEAHEGIYISSDERAKYPVGIDMYALEDLSLSNAKRQLMARQLRSAVIMAEILNPPLSRRRR